MFKKRFFLILPLVTLICVANGQSQEEEAEEIIHKDEIGVNFDLAMSGFGFGGFYRKAIAGYSYLGVNLNFFIMRDDKEFEYYDVFGLPRKANDINRLFFIPLNLEFKKRLFAEDIEDNFRPNFVIQGGVIYGMNFPKVEGLKNESQFSFDFAFGFGIDITNKEKYFVSIRPQYRIIYFPEEIAQKKNHSNFEIKIELGGRLL